MNKVQKLNNGVEIPSLGFGTFLIPDGYEVEEAVGSALNLGYTHIDCAAIYNNEKGVGNAIKKCGIQRKNLFIVSKVWNDRQSYQDTLDAFQESLDRLQTDYLDMYLIHWPKEQSSECWRAMEKLYEDKKVRALGVSNFTIQQMDKLLKSATVVPVVNQVELHPQFPQSELKEYCKSKGILMESWGPLMQGQIFSVNLINELAQKYSCTVAQFAIRWQLQQDNICLVKSVNLERIKSNFNIPEFTIKNSDLIRMNSLIGKRIGADPDNFDF